MNRRERLRRCFNHEELDRPAVFTRTGYPPNDPSYDRMKRYMEEYSELKLGWHAGVRDGYPIEVRTQPYSPEFEWSYIILHTPAGDFEQSRLVGLKNQPGMDKTYFIKDRADAERFLSLPLPAPEIDTAPFFALDREIGERGIVDASLGTNPAGMIADLCGSETFAIMSITDRDVLHALCDRQMRAIIARVKYLIAQGVGPYFGLSGQELVAPPLHSPRDFHDFNTRYDKPIIDLIHEAGGRVHIHCHGSLKKVFHDFVEMGCDVLHPVEPPPMGDLPAAEAKRMAQGRVCIEGNIQIAHMYEHTPEQVRAETAVLIADAFRL